MYLNSALRSTSVTSTHSRMGSVYDFSSLDTAPDPHNTLQVQFNLMDIGIFKSPQPLKPEGLIKIHLPDMSCFTVEYNRRETTMILREKIQAKTNLKLKNYYLVSGNGVISNDTTLDEYIKKPDQDIILVRKGIRNRQANASRKFWLESREKRLNSNEPPQFFGPQTSRSRLMSSTTSSSLQSSKKPYISSTFSD